MKKLEKPTLKFNVMPFTFTMPKLSPTMEEGVIAKWHKKEGEFVQPGELLLEVTTDKATVEHNALDEGWLRKILVSEGGAAKINQPIAVFSENESEKITDFLKTLEPQKKEEPMAEVKKEEEKKEAKVATGALQEPAFTPSAPLSEVTFPFPEEKDQVVASPFAKKVAKEKGLDLTTVKGSGPGGRITSEDLERALPSKFVTFGSRESPTVPPGSYEEIPTSPMRKIIAKRLQESKTFIPHFYVKQVIDAEPLFNLREQLKKLELKVTFNDMIIKGAAIALKKHPEVNSGYNSVNKTIIRFKTIDISVAVNIPDGLITPIIRYADFKNLGEIGVEMKLLAEKAKKGKLQEQEYKGGSFCVSNLGMFGITEFSAVINPPQAAILAVGGIEEQPVVKEGMVVPGKTLALVLSVDHRVIDGSLAAEFLKSLQFFLENPISLIL